MAYTSPGHRATGIANFLNRKTPRPRTVLDEFEVLTQKYGRLPMAVEVRRDHLHERNSPTGGPRWIAEFGMPGFYIDVECHGLHGETPRQAYREAIQRQRELFYTQLQPDFGREFQTLGGALRGVLVELKLLASGVLLYGLRVAGVEGIQWFDELLIEPVVGG